MADQPKAWAPPLVVVSIALALVAAKGIDKSQWSNQFRAGAGSTSSGATEGGSTAGGSSDSGSPMAVSRPKSTTVAVSTVLVQTAVDTCWALTIDADRMNGCGPAALTDTVGSATARITRTRGHTTIRLDIVRSGRTLASGTTSITGREITVAGR